MPRSRIRFFAALFAASTFIAGCTSQPPAQQSSSGATPAPAEAPPQVPPPATQIAGVPAGTVFTPEYAATVAQFAYVWGWPLVNHLNRSLGVKDVPQPGRLGGIAPVAPWGRISMLTDYINAGERLITCPNQDTVYGAGFQHLEVNPAVIQVPDFGKRFWVYQVLDGRTESVGGLGQQYGTKPGFYAFVGPNWNGTMPAGITHVFHSPTDMIVILPRAFQDDTAEDKAAIQPLLNQIVAYPLSEFDGKMKTIDWKATPNFPAPAGSSGETKWVIPEKFWDELPVILKTVPPQPGEEAMYSTFQSLLDAAEKDPKLKQVLVQTAVATEKNVVGPLFEFHNNGRPIGNGWNSPPNGANWGYDYLSRLATARSNMYDNAPQETRYIYTDYDSSGARLNGSHGGYTVTFPAGQTPPVDGFWSLTLYNKEHLFEPNSLNRFSLGTKSKSMKLAPDGSLTIYVQNTSPGADKADNWLPAPRDNFSLYIRAYWPKAEITSGKWVPPLVKSSH